MSCSIRISVISGSSSSRRSVSATRSPRESPEAGSSSIISAGFDGARHRNLELALLAVRERADERLLAAAEADEARELACPLAHLAVAARQDDRTEVPALHAEHGQVEVVLDREAREQPRLLVGAAHPELRPRARRRGR